MVLMRSTLFNLLLILAPLQAAADLTIFDVRKNIAMSDSDPVYRDFIINGGSDAGLSVGMLLTVQRRLPLYDSYQNRSAGDLQLKVARIKIIYVQKTLAVARLHNEFTREAAPLLEDNFIMVGDHIDLASASSDKGDKKSEAAAEKEEALTPAAEAPKPVPTAAASEAPKAVAQIVVNTVDLSSKTVTKSSPTPNEKVDVQQLQ
jgi:hypothetical protein